MCAAYPSKTCRSVHLGVEGPQRYSIQRLPCSLLWVGGVQEALDGGSRNPEQILNSSGVCAQRSQPAARHGPPF